MYYQGDIIEVSFDPSRGHEAEKTLPAVVLGCNRFNQMSNVSIVAPITSTDNKYPLHIAIAPQNAVHGYICLEHLASLDLSARKCQTLGSLDPLTMTQVLDALGAIFDI